MKHEPTGKTYEITTLRDIFNLPTIEAMETCLDETKRVMMQLRATLDMVREIARLQGIDGSVAEAEFPEPLRWIDDGKGESTINFKAGGENVLTIKTSKRKGGK